MTNQNDFKNQFKNQFKDINFTSSKVKFCEVNGKQVETLKYRAILYNNIIPEIEPEVAIETTNLKMDTNKYIKRQYKGYDWCDYLNCSIRGISGTETLYEIMHLVKVHNISISMIIESNNGCDFII